MTTERKVWHRIKVSTPANGAASKSFTRILVNLDDDRVGSNNPKWRNQVAKHVNAGTHFERVLEDVQCNYVDAWVEWGNGNPKYNREEYYGGPGATPLLPVSGGASSDVLNSLSKQASIALILKARAAQQELQALVSLGEMGQTLRMLRNPAKALFSSILDYSNRARRRARKVKRPKDKNKVISNLYLEAMYGWLPLASDIEGAYKALHDLPTDRYRKVTAQAPEYAINTTSMLTNYVLGTLVFTREQRVTLKAGCRAYGEVKIATTVKGGTFQRFGIAASEFLPTVWELIPYSFLVDYFTNIGDVIAAATYPMSNFAWHGLTLREETTRLVLHSLSREGTATTTGPDFHDCGSNTWSNTGRRLRIERHSAIDQISLGLSNVSFEIPGLGRKWLNMAALANARR